MSNLPARSEEKQCSIEGRLDAYKSFFDHDWAGRLFSLADKTKLCPLVFDLCMDWKAAANTVRMPWLMLHSLDWFQQGLMQIDESFAGQLAIAFREYVLTKMGSSLSNMKRKEIAQIIDELRDKTLEEMKHSPHPFQIDLA